MLRKYDLCYSSKLLMRVCPELQVADESAEGLSVAAVSRGAMVVADTEDAAKKQKGSKSLPKGVIETGRKAIKYQARVSYKPDGSKTVQRNAGTFDTPEEAALQIAAYEAKLAEGMDPWDGAEIRSQHKRGQVWRSILMLRCSRIPVCLNQGSTLAGTANED